jgi:hypothetical protein
MPDSSSGLSFQIDAERLRPLIEAVIEQTLLRLEQIRATLPDRMAFGESEAARLIGLQAHQLRDERLRGRVEASVGPGKRLLYRRQDLEKYLLSRRWNGNGNGHGTP